MIHGTVLDHLTAKEVYKIVDLRHGYRILYCIIGGYLAVHQDKLPDSHVGDLIWVHKVGDNNRFQPI